MAEKIPKHTMSREEFSKRALIDAPREGTGGDVFKTFRPRYRWIGADLAISSSRLQNPSYSEHRDDRANAGLHVIHIINTLAKGGDEAVMMVHDAAACGRRLEQLAKDKYGDQNAWISIAQGEHSAAVLRKLVTSTLRRLPSDRGGDLPARGDDPRMSGILEDMRGYHREMLRSGLELPTPEKDIGTFEPMNHLSEQARIAGRAGFNNDDILMAHLWMAIQTNDREEIDRLAQDGVTPADSVPEAFFQGSTHDRISPEIPMFHYTASLDHVSPETVKHMLGYVGDINAPDGNGMNVLHYAAMGGAGKEKLDNLVSLGADPSMKSKTGFLPEEEAICAGHKAASAWLRKARLERPSQTSCQQERDERVRLAAKRRMEKARGPSGHGDRDKAVQAAAKRLVSKIERASPGGKKPPQRDD